MKMSDNRLTKRVFIYDRERNRDTWSSDMRIIYLPLGINQFQSIFISKYMHILHSVHRHSCLHFKILLYIYFQETNINLRLLLHSVKIKIIS